MVEFPLSLLWGYITIKFYKSLKVLLNNFKKFIKKIDLYPILILNQTDLKNVNIDNLKNDHVLISGISKKLYPRKNNLIDSRIILSELPNFYQEDFLLKIESIKFFKYFFYEN